MKTPKNEQGVVVLFGIQALKVGWEIKEIQQSFPDAIIEKNGKEYVVEFEYRASNFIAHKHDPCGCDLIICWENDLNNEIDLPIIELCNDAWLNDNTLDNLESSASLKAAAHWKDRAIAAEYLLSQMLLGIPVDWGVEYDTSAISHAYNDINQSSLHRIKYTYRWEPFARRFFADHPSAKSADLAICMAMATNDGRSYTKFMSKAGSLRKQILGKDSNQEQSSCSYECEMEENTNAMLPAIDKYNNIYKEVKRLLTSTDWDESKSISDYIHKKSEKNEIKPPEPIPVIEKRLPAQDVEPSLIDVYNADIRLKHGRWRRFAREFLRLSKEMDTDHPMRKYPVAELADRMAVAELGYYSKSMADRRKSQASQWLQKIIAEGN